MPVGILSDPLPIQSLYAAPGNATTDGTITWVPTIRAGDPGGVPDSDFGLFQPQSL